MQFSPLAAVRHRVTVGAPLPFNVRNADGTLLLARSQIIEDQEQLIALMARGTLVDLAELRLPTEAIRMAPREALPSLWSQTLEQVGETLVQAAADGFLPALETVAPQIGDLAARDPDLAIFQILQHEGGENARHGAELALRAAIVCQLVARRLGWSDKEAQRVMKAALTMNISMLELQGQLAVQEEPPSPDQLEAIEAHAEFSARMLRLAGVTDADWLRAVELHHRPEDGSGSAAACDMAALMNRAERYVAKLSGRASRDAVAADAAARAMFTSEPGHPMVAALVKEFGAYPPGCFVRLASEELAVVVRRGPTVVTPVVAVLVDAEGKTLPQPIRRDTALPKYAVRAVVAARDARVQVDLKKLVLL
jgi:hypothetical protein